MKTMQFELHLFSEKLPESGQPILGFLIAQGLPIVGWYEEEDGKKMFVDAYDDTKYPIHTDPEEAHFNVLDGWMVCPQHKDLPKSRIETTVITYGNGSKLVLLPNETGEIVLRYVDPQGKSDVVPDMRHSDRLPECVEAELARSIFDDWEQRRAGEVVDLASVNFDGASKEAAKKFLVGFSY